ncbi:PLD nuclease N-terminal domain-containing protein [Microbacterium stercoris]|uniref:PLDc_N domain-containing protein n=1 Tax=Microbacterium stercoris TaxID=2820289 RepID=A0A939TTD6_9MICO|nr:PLD nuclease N-terminal domain-containing protein [Microbacterium stercoris]MBO3662864.1 PLDc_N domain-containing protein [Microbacterium stercoris]
MPYVISFAVFAFSVLTLIDIITKRDDQVNHLPKLVWVILAILIPVLGGVLWWTVGREWPAREPRDHGWRGAAPSAATGGIRIVDDRAPRDVRDLRSTEQQLADLEREIEADRLRAELARRRAERGE